MNVVPFSLRWKLEKEGFSPRRFLTFIYCYYYFYGSKAWDDKRSRGSLFYDGRNIFCRPCMPAEKDHKMSKASLCKLRSEFAGREITQDTTEKRVEIIVTKLVKDEFCRIYDHRKLGTSDGKRKGQAQSLQSSIGNTILVHRPLLKMFMNKTVAVTAAVKKTKWRNSGRGKAPERGSQAEGKMPFRSNGLRTF